MEIDLSEENVGYMMNAHTHMHALVRSWTMTNRGSAVESFAQKYSQKVIDIYVYMIIL